MRSSSASLLVQHRGDKKTVCTSDGTFPDGALSESVFTAGSFSDGSLSDDTLSDGSLSDGSLSDGALSGGALSEATSVVFSSGVAKRSSIFMVSVTGSVTGLSVVESVLCSSCVPGDGRTL